MTDFELGSDFLFIQTASADMINITSMPPDPKNIKRKSLLLIKARQESEPVDEEEAEDNNFPTGIANEVVFMEITGKTLSNLYASCQVSQNFNLTPKATIFLNFESLSCRYCWLVQNFKFEFLSQEYGLFLILAVGFSEIKIVSVNKIELDLLIEDLDHKIQISRFGL